MASQTSDGGGSGDGAVKGSRPRRRGRRLLVVLVVGALLVGVVVAVAPMVASSMAPGRIENSLNPVIQGRIKVAKAGIGWFKPLRAGPIEVYDEGGVLAARVEVMAPVTVWRALTGRWWSARRLDIGTIEVAGELDLKQYSDGTTSLQRALSPKPGATVGAGRPAATTSSQPAGASSKPLPSIKAGLRITSFDASVRSESDGFKSELGLKGLKGDATIDADLGALGGAAIKALADFAGTALLPGGTAAGQPMTLKLDADLKQGKSGSWAADGFDRAKVKLSLTNAPIAVIDAVAQLGGALVEGMGEKADISADIDGGAGSLGAKLTLVSGGVTADADLAIRDGFLTATAGKPTGLSMKSTEFLAKLPQTRGAIARAAQQIRLTGAPSIEISLDKLSVPLTKSSAAGGSDMSKLDFRGANVGARIKVSGMSGQVAIPEGGAVAAGSESRPANWKPFTVEPLEFALSVDDFSKPVRIATGTRATLDGKPAGDIAISAIAEGLLDSNGRVRALQRPASGFADKAEARIALTGVSTALLQPIASGTGLPLELATDIGPTLDLSVTANADVKGVTGAGSDGILAIPPSTVTIQARSTNLTADADIKLTAGVLTAGPAGIKFTAGAAAPLVQRILAAGATAENPAPATLSGSGRVELTVGDLNINLGEKDKAKQLAAARVVAELRVADVTAAPNLGGSGTPVRVETLGVSATLAPGDAPKFSIASALAHSGGNFGIDGAFALEGLRGKGLGAPKSKGLGMVSELNPIGTLAVKDLPRDVLWAVKALNDKFGPQGTEANATEMSRAIAQAAREAVGQNLTLNVRTLAVPTDKGGGQYQNVKLETAAKGVFADLWSRMNDKEFELTSGTVFLANDPRWVNPLLAAMKKPVATATGGAQAASVAPAMRLGAPHKVYLGFEKEKPTVVPLKRDANGAVSLDLAKATDLNAKLSVEGDIVVENISITTEGEGANARPKLATFALSETSGAAVIPLSGLVEGQKDAKRASVKLNSKALDRTAGAQQIATLSIDGGATMSGKQPEATIKLGGVNVAQIERTLGKPDLLVGALGESAEATLNVKPLAVGAVAGAKGETTSIEAEMTSPRISGAAVSMAMDDEKMWLTKPSSITWQPNAAFINRFLLGGEAGGLPAAPSQPQQPDRPRRGPAGGAGAGAGASQPAAMSLQDAQPITIQLGKLAIAKGQTDASGQAIVGPLKAGVFDLGASVSAPSLSMNVPSSGGAPTAMTIEGTKIDVRSTRTEAGTAGIEAALNIAKISGGSAGTGKPSTATIRLNQLAGAAGIVDSAGARLAADLNLESFPTPIVDTLANQNGLMTELLGPTVTLVATAKNVSPGKSAEEGAEGSAALDSGALDATATSQRATAKLKGRVRGGRFVQTGPVEIELREIRTQLVEMLAGGLPMVDSLEKTAKDDPAKIVTERLAIPLDKDLRRLSGKVTVDPGVARFTTNNLLAKLLKGLGGKESGTIGRKIEPFVVNIDKGVARYERFKLPFGEFNIETRGEVDLVGRNINIVTYAPLFALSDEALGKLRVGIPGNLNVIDRLTMVPITTKGSMDNPKTELDIGLFVKELGDGLVKEPGKIIGDVLGDLLNKDKDKKK